MIMMEKHFFQTNHGMHAMEFFVIHNSMMIIRGKEFGAGRTLGLDHIG